MIQNVCAKCGRLIADGAGPLCDWCGQTGQAPPPPEPQAARPVVFTPYATYFLMGVSVVVYALMVLSGVSVKDATPQQLIRWGADYGPLTLTREPWRMISAQFVHVRWDHIFFNMWCLYSLGATAEAIYKRTTYISIYLLSGALGSVASLAVYPTTPSAGASGAIFGIAGALISAFKVGRLPLPPSVLKAQLTNLFVFTGVNLLYGQFARGVNNAAHLGGLGAGALLGVIIAVAVRNRQQYRRARNIAIALLIVIIVGGYFTVRELRAATAVAAAHQRNGHEALRQQKWAEAQSEFEAANRLQPNNEDVLVQLAIASIYNGNPSKAEPLLRRAIELNPADAQAYADLSFVLETLGRTAEAISAMEKASSLSPGQPIFHEELARLYENNGRHADSVAEQTRADILRKQSGDGR